MKFETLNELIVALILWITTYTNYPEPQNQIIIESISQESLGELACGRPCEIMAYTPMDEKSKLTFLSINSLSTDAMAEIPIDGVKNNLGSSKPN